MLERLEHRDVLVLDGGIGAYAEPSRSALAIGVVGRKQAVPYAPFLALAAVAVVLTQGAAFAPL